MRKLLNALWAVIAHAVVLIAAHNTAEHVGHEILGLVRDEWFLQVADLVIP